VLATDENLYDVYGVSGDLLEILTATALVVLILIAAIILVRRARLRRRKLRAFIPCQRCGFDLRATTGPCPECGAPRPKPPLGKNDLFDDFEDKPWHA
jgi:hypothetical protein